jgi:hypothetical protein
LLCAVLRSDRTAFRFGAVTLAERVLHGRSHFIGLPKCRLELGRH